MKSEKNKINGIPLDRNLKNVKKIIASLELQNSQMLELATRKGFFNVYYDNCKKFKTKQEAFNVVNKKYFSLFGVLRYTDFNRFKKINSYYNN